MPLGYVMNVGADALTDLGNFVDKGDLRGQEGVGGVFDHFGARDVGGDNGSFEKVERCVEVAS